MSYTSEGKNRSARGDVGHDIEVEVARVRLRVSFLAGDLALPRLFE